MPPMIRLSMAERERLRGLRATGWTVHHFGPAGTPTVVGATIRRGPFVDVIVIRGRDDSAAYRTHVGSAGVPSQDVWEPETVEWYWVGPMLSTVDQATTTLASRTHRDAIPAPPPCGVPMSMRRPHRMLFPTTRTVLSLNES